MSGKDNKGRFVKGNKLSPGAALGNKCGTKLKEPDIRQEAYKQYCEYLASGRSKQGWTFRHPELSCTHETMEKYISENPTEFAPINKKLAESSSFNVWEEKGMNMLNSPEKCQPAIYQMFMRNKFGWDKESVDDIAECAADKILERLTKNQ